TRPPVAGRVRLPGGGARRTFPLRLAGGPFDPSRNRRGSGHGSSGFRLSPAVAPSLLPSARPQGICPGNLSKRLVLRRLARGRTRSALESRRHSRIGPSLRSCDLSDLSSRRLLRGPPYPARVGSPLPSRA